MSEKQLIFPRIKRPLIRQQLDKLIASLPESFPASEPIDFSDPLNQDALRSFSVSFNEAATGDTVSKLAAGSATGLAGFVQFAGKCLDSADPRGKEFFLLDQEHGKMEFGLLSAFVLFRSEEGKAKTRRAALPVSNLAGSQKKW